MSLKFYYAPMSTASVTNLVIEELGVPCEKITVDLKKGDTHKPEFLRLNPNGKVPLIVHDGTPIWESAAITMYLGEVFGVAKSLYPAPGPKRGLAMQWITWANVTLGDAIGRWQRNVGPWTPPDHHNAKAGAAGLADVHSCLALLNHALEGRQFLVDGYTLADTHLNSFMDWGRHMQVDFTAYPHLNAWSARCSARPAYTRSNGGA